MTVSAIVYTSNTGYTAEYARLLSEKLSLPVYTLEEAKNALPAGTEIVCLGWLMASFVSGYNKASKLFSVRAVCGVCMGESGSQIDDVRKNNKIPAEVTVFTMQGGFDMKKLCGMYKFMMKFMVKKLTKDIMSKPVRTNEDEKLLHMMTDGASYVDPQALYPVIDALQKQKITEQKN